MNSRSSIKLTKPKSMANFSKNVSKTKIKEELDKSTGTQEIDKEASDAIVAQGKSLVTAKNGNDNYETTLQNISASIDKFDEVGEEKQKEIVELSDEAKEKQLMDINDEMENNNYCLSKAMYIRRTIDMFNDIYLNETMKGDGLEGLKNKAVELCFAQHSDKNACGFSYAGDNIVSMISGKPTWGNLITTLGDQSQKARSFASTMRHELTHYTQGLLVSLDASKREKLSQQAKEAIKLFMKEYPKDIQHNYKDYVLHPKEMGARTTEILSQLEKTCGLQYGEFCFQEKGTDDARREHAEKIVNTLDQYLKQEKGQSLAQFLNIHNKSPEGGMDRHGFYRLLDLFTFDVPDCDGKIEMIKHDEELQLSKEDLTSADANEKIINCFEHLLKYIIPREDMRVIAQELGSKDKSFIDTEKELIYKRNNLSYQIEAYNSQIKLYESLQNKMQSQDGSICMPSINYLSSQIEELEKKVDVRRYKKLKAQLEEAQASNQDTTKLSEQVNQYSTIPIVQSYIHLNKLINESKLIDLGNKLQTIDVDNLQEAKKKIDEIKAQIQEFGDNVQKRNIESLSNIINDLIENAKSKEMSLDDKQKYIKSKLSPEIQDCQMVIRLLKSINIDTNDIDENRELLKSIFNNDASSIDAIEAESKALGWFKAINKVKNCNYTTQQKIDYLNKILPAWKNDSNVTEVLNEYLKNALSKPDQESALLDNVLKVFKNIYINSIKKTNEIILKNPQNQQKIKRYLTNYENQLEKLQKYCNSASDEFIKNSATQLKAQFQQAKSLAISSLHTMNVIISSQVLINKNLNEYISEKNIMENIQKQTSEIIYQRHEQEKSRNDCLYKGDGKEFERTHSPIASSFETLKEQLEKLPIGIQSQLKLYSNWAQRGLEKFQDWAKALAK